MNILAQIMGLIALILLVVSYQQKSKKKFLFIQIFANICYGIQYFLLSAFSASISSVISIVRTLLFYKNEKDKKQPKIIELIIIEVISVLFGVITYQNIFSIIPIFITIIYTYGTWQKKLKITYKIGIIASILWIIYNFVVGAYVSTIGSVFELCASIIGYIKISKNTVKED